MAFTGQHKWIIYKSHGCAIMRCGVKILNNLRFMADELEALK
jgi:hypothetical protein